MFYWIIEIILNLICLISKKNKAFFERILFLYLSRSWHHKWHKILNNNRKNCEIQKLTDSIANWNLLGMGNNNFWKFYQKFFFGSIVGPKRNIFLWVFWTLKIFFLKVKSNTSWILVFFSSKKFYIKTKILFDSSLSNFHRKFWRQYFSMLNFFLLKYLFLFE